jgi:hypothetical protein
MLRIKLLISRGNFQGKAVVLDELIKISALHVAPKRMKGKIILLTEIFGKDSIQGLNLPKFQQKDKSPSLEGSLLSL